VLAHRGVVAAAQQPVHDGGEGGLELLVGHHVDDGVQGRVEVAYPEERGDEDVWTVAGVPAEREGEIPREEGQPAHQEGAHHHAQRHERLVFFPPHRTANRSPFMGPY